MPIPIAQLNTWANQGGTTVSTAACASIRNALLKSTSPVVGLGLDVYLQGSYPNTTNIHGDSDIDVVVLYPDTFGRDISALTPMQVFHMSPLPIRDAEPYRGQAGGLFHKAQNVNNPSFTGSYATRCERTSENWLSGLRYPAPRCCRKPAPPSQSTCLP